MQPPTVRLSTREAIRSAVIINNQNVTVCIHGTKSGLYYNPIIDTTRDGNPIEIVRGICYCIWRQFDKVYALIGNLEVVTFITQILIFLFFVVCVFFAIQTLICSMIYTHIYTHTHTQGHTQAHKYTLYELKLAPQCTAENVKVICEFC